MRRFFIFIFLLVVIGCEASPDYDKNGDLLPEDLKREQERQKSNMLKLRKGLESIAKAGKADAQYQYGMTFCCGEGDYLDNKMAIEWICKAARRGNADAQNEIGNIYRSDRSRLQDKRYIGKNLPVNNRLSYLWYSIAAKGGQRDAVASQYEVAKIMPSSDLMEAKRMVSSYPSIPCEAY